MIPRLLELKNFLSYGEPLQKIDFSGHSLICLSGKNGNGKSALLDAITWALWGQARKTAGATKADAGLLRLGQTRMLVSLEFEFSQRIYRVRREFAQSYGSKPYAALDFEVLDQEGKQFMSLTDKTIRATQDKIERTLGLDYATFVNSAFLRQGQSNEFSKKSSKDRKNVLANILGLSKYDQLAHLAQTTMRTLNENRKCLKAVYDQQQQEIAKEEDVSKNLDETKKLLHEQEKSRLALQKKFDVLEKKRTECITKKNTLVLLDRQDKDLKKTYSEQLSQLQTMRNQWKRIHMLSLSQPNISLLQKEKEALVARDKQMRDAQQKQVKIQEELIALKDDYQKQATKLAKQHDVQLALRRKTLQQEALELGSITTLITQKEKQLENLYLKQKEFDKRLTELTTKIKEHKPQQEAYNKITQQFEKRRNFYQLLVQKGNFLRNQLSELKQKQTTLEDPDNPACPLCLQLLTQKRKLYLGKQIGKEAGFFVHQFNRIKDLINKLKTLLVTQHKDVEKLSQQHEEITRVSAQENEIQKNNDALLREINELKKEIAGLQKESLDKTKKHLAAKKDFEKVEQAGKDVSSDPLIKKIIARAKALELEKKELAFDNKAYQALHEKLDKLEKNLTELQELKEARAGQEERKKIISRQCHQLKQLKDKRKALAQELCGLPHLEKDTLEIQKEIGDLQQNLTAVNQQKEKLLGNLGSLEHELKRLTQLKKEAATKNNEIKKLDQEIDDYQALAGAFSKNGIQALLIEEAIPEIEHEANDILSRLTDNQAHIFIESLRDLKSGGVRETLDIHITDAAGSRPYEMYSGGEAFRVDFALRIAISKLLARRAGTALQTLIIDEGFGSQDEEGLARIMQAIYAIQEDFEKIIIVSHLPEFKHNFPVHFIVQKGPAGSVIEIEQRG